MNKGCKITPFTMLNSKLLIPSQTHIGKILLASHLPNANFFCCDDPVQNEILEFWKLFAMFDDCVQFFAPVCQHQHKKIVYFAKAVSRVSLKSSIFATAKILLI